MKRLFSGLGTMAEDAAKKHQDLALKLLVGRSLPTGLPWTLEEDHVLIVQERLLWARMTVEEQAASQAFLASLWKHKGAADRMVPVNPAWGPWTAKMPVAVAVPDTAFGLPAMGYVPWTRGVFQHVPDSFIPVMRWFWLRGFQVVSLEGDTLTVVTPPHRGMHESDRLLGLIAKLKGMEGKIGTQRDGGKMTIRASYDPVAGVATIVVTDVQFLIGKVKAT